MKILEKGELPRVLNPRWWHGLVIKCRRCKAMIELESGDLVSEINERRPNGEQRINLVCPTENCNATLTYKKP